ncbi:LysR family transcriptional regulator [Halomonas denitrificans]|nr:LysR family transcriptional regulator [Halomonas denitrificans]
MDYAERLLLFLDITESGSFVGASELRQIDRSVVSKQFSKLEKELGVRLLNRTTRSISLTSAGQEMVTQAVRLRTLLEESRVIAQRFHVDPVGSLRITSTRDFGRQYVQQAVIAFQQRYPAINIELRLDDRMQDLVAEGFDLGFRTGKPKDSSLIARKVARNRLLLVASPDFLERHGEPKTIEDLERLPAAVYSSDGQTIDKIKYYDPLGHEAHARLNVVFRSDEIEVIKNAAAAGNVVAAITAQSVGNEVIEGKLRPILTDVPLVDFGTFYVVYPHKDLPQKTRLFLDLLRELLGDTQPEWERRIPDFEQMYQRKPATS